MARWLNGKFIGGTLLITGTSIGGAMLALPVSNGGAGFVHSSIFLLLAWAVMTVGSLLVLEVNLLFPPGSNIISMSRKTLGSWGVALAWGSYLLLLYALLSAYTAGGSDLFHYLLNVLGVSLPQSVGEVIYVCLMGSIVFCGIRTVDFTNRGLMSIKFASLFGLIVLLIPHVNIPYLLAGNLKHIRSALLVLITSFGFATIVPSLRSYFKEDVVALRWAIIVGSFIPLISYILWDMATMGVIPRLGAGGLVSIGQTGHAVSGLTQAIQNVLHNVWVTDMSRIFLSVCMLTSFLSVSLGMVDFFADGLKFKKRGKHAWVVYGATFVPPVLLVLLLPGVFVIALRYAGILCVILLVLLPAMMAWSARYHKHMVGDYRVKGGRSMLLSLMLISIILVVVGLF